MTCPRAAAGSRGYTQARERALRIVGRDGGGAVRRWIVGLGLAALFSWSAVQVVGFYRQHWPSIVRLPAITAAAMRRHHAQPVVLSAVSPWFLKALIATEDRTFYTNLGVSLQGIVRSFWVDLQEGAYVQGGSTITQQLVRDQLLTTKKTFRRKLSGALLALAVTARYPKPEILDLYVNQVYLGNGYWGVGSAARGYFGTSARRLSPAQAAVLAGLPQAPSALDPLVHLRAARQREWVVLENLVAIRALTPARAHQIFRMPLHLVRHS